MEDVHQRVEPQEEPIPTLIAPYETDDSAPAEDEIALAVKQLKSGKSPGATKMTASHLKKWCRQAHPLKEEDVPQPEAWNKLVELAQHTWEHSELPQELCCCVQVMIPKPDGGSGGIGLLEAVLKVLECIINSCVSAKVKLHDCLHGFGAARGTDTAQIESKLFQQLAGIDQETLFKACLDWAKAFAAFHKERAFMKLHEHRLPTKMLTLLALQWDKMQVIPKQADFFGTPFCQDSGQITGSILGPLIFNVVVDSVVRHWMTVMVDDGGTSAMTGLTLKELLLLLCADDGMIASRDPAWLQEALTALVALFRWAGLEINVKKTKVITCHPGFIKTHFSDARCKRRITGAGPSPQQLKKTDVICRCNKKMNKASLLAHLERIHGEPCAVLPELPEAFLASHQPRACVIINWPRVHKKWACPVEGCPALCYSSKRLVNTWHIVPYEHELEYQSSASAPMICAVSLWKSSHACSDGAKVRDSTVHQAGSTLRTLLHARLACIFDCLCAILLCVFRMCFVFAACYIQ